MPRIQNPHDYPRQNYFNRREWNERHVKRFLPTGNSSMRRRYLELKKKKSFRLPEIKNAEQLSRAIGEFTGIGKDFHLIGFF